MLNKAKLEELLHKYGEYPVRYRRLVWQFLLQLPGNRDAFEQLQRRGMHRCGGGRSEPFQAYAEL
jgi:hypothetical protein